MTTRVQQVIDATDIPATVASLTASFQALGIQPGMVLAVHSSLSAIGYVVGGPAAVVLALEAALGPEGTLAMPAHGPDPSSLNDWGVPASWHQTIRANLPAFHPDLTPPRQDMGAIAHCFRSQDGTLRSSHPFVSWVARGPAASRITAGHQLAMSQGEGSPLARLYELDARVLLLGVGHHRNTSLHLAEYRSIHTPARRCTRYAVVDGRSGAQWQPYDDISWRDAEFTTLGAAFEQSAPVQVAPVAKAPSRLFHQRHAVDFAVNWLNTHSPKS